MAIVFVKRFDENENATTITFKRYNADPEDMYPTFSICFKGTQLHWYYDLNIYNAFELRSDQYQEMLKGKPAFRYHYDPKLRLFKKRLTFVNNGSTADFNKFHLKINDILLDANFTSLEATHSHSFRKKNGQLIHQPPFDISYQSPDMICFARGSAYVSNLIRLEDSLSLNKTLMENVMFLDTELLIFIHYPGQLIRSLDIPSFTSSFLRYQQNKLLSFKISQSTIVRERSDYREPCDSTIKNYDRYLMNKVINKTRCIPSYWKDDVPDRLGLLECTSKEMLRIAFEDIRDWKKVMEDNDRPCVDMYTIAGWNWEQIEGAKSSDETNIKFRYQEKYYQELRYLPDFDLETFISNIGGFVGIFLGYSMMQFPELIGMIIT